MESARPYYAESWAPILYAATLWLNTRGFDVADTTIENANDNKKSGSSTHESHSGNPTVERFHLLFGKNRFCLFNSYFYFD